MKMTVGSGFIEGRGGRVPGMFGDADMSGAPGRGELVGSGKSVG
ncbi:hypothetical protein [Caballeronia sp. SEWSISQ10-4 2]|nr:hypothetical protein [Caballeronia sp. SEWSISQ10-4 2]